MGTIDFVFVILPDFDVLYFKIYIYMWAFLIFKYFIFDILSCLNSYWNPNFAEYVILLVFSTYLLLQCFICFKFVSIRIYIEQHRKTTEEFSRVFIIYLFRLLLHIGMKFFEIYIERERQRNFSIFLVNNYLFISIILSLGMEFFEIYIWLL